MSGIYGRKFFAKRQKKYRLPQLKLAAVLYKLWTPSSVYDLGCGIGSLLEGFLYNGCHAQGSELGYKEARRFMDSNVRGITIELDATKPIATSTEYALVISMEVAEHIDANASGIFCRNLVQLSNKRIFLTAAAEGQRGTGHINCHNQDYWRDLMLLAGAKFQPQETAEAITAIKAVGDELNICKNLMVFRV